MAHALGATFHIPHGKSNAILLPYVIEYNAGIMPGRIKPSGALAKYADAARILGLPASTDEIGTRNLIRAANALMRSIGVEPTVKSAGVAQAEFGEKVGYMASVAAADRCTPTNPVAVTQAELKELYWKSYFGK
jgi:alcohol dehydrogenase class IV